MISMYQVILICQFNDRIFKTCVKCDTRLLSTATDMQRLDSILAEILFWLITMITIGATWLFGSWETWWFWPFMTLIFLATAGFSIRLALCSVLGTRRLNLSTIAVTILIAWIPLIIYSLVRSLQADVAMDAERSFLLQLSPVLLGLIVATGLTESRQRLLLIMIMINFSWLGVYGIANHYLTGNDWVLWIPAFPQYQQDYHRATGTYFCPDHFSGLMEIALCLAVSFLMSRYANRWQRFMALGLCLIALLGIVLSRSRGGGITTGIILIAALLLCTLSWPRKARWFMRGTGLAGLTLVIAAFIMFGGHYVQRFKEYPWAKLQHSDRFQMSAAAMRAWKTAPWMGVGPGMHPNLWPHFAPTADGDRSIGRWPTFPNNNYHSFEAHNDWAQFLEEYGLAGAAFLLLALGVTLWLILRRWKRWAMIHALPALSQSSCEWLLPGILLVALAMGIHSFGDFNLQIPGTTWTIGILTGLAVAIARNTPPFRKRSSTAGMMDA